MAQQVITVSADAQSVNDGGTTLVANTSEKVLDAYATRLGVIFSADVADVWLSLGTADAVVDKGIVVRAAGEAVRIQGWAGEIHAISTGAAKLAWAELDAEAGEEGGEEPTGAAAFVPSGPSDNYFETAVATTPDRLASTPGAEGGWTPNSDESIEPAVH
jgi:hypothetical protein